MHRTKWLKIMSFTGHNSNIVHVFHWTLSLPLNHSPQFMSVLVNPRSRLLGSVAEVGMCHYSQYNSHNIYDTGCPIWTRFLSAGPPEDALPGALVALLWDICSSPLGVMQYSRPQQFVSRHVDMIFRAVTIDYFQSWQKIHQQLFWWFWFII